MKDWRGVEIEPEQTVIYGVKSGSAGVEQRVATVIETVPKEQSSAYYPEDKVRLRVVAMNRSPTVHLTRPTLVGAHMLTVVELPAVDS